jgi:BolA protein
VTRGRIERIRHKLQSAFAPATLEIHDDSALHAGHAGARGGAGHYAVSIQAEVFRGMRQLERHRLVYKAVADMIPQEIHALTIDAAAPGEN